MPPHRADSSRVAVLAAPATVVANDVSRPRALAWWRAVDLRWPLLWPLLGYAALRAWLLTSTKVNSDEPQHLHVVWAWAQHALVPYRDVFDNHVPLFHMLLAPWLRWLGETPDVLLWARLLMLPLAVAAVACSAWLGLRVWDRAVARGAVLVLAAISSYALVAGEFRTDALWGAAWIAGVAVLATGGLGARRMVVAGVLFGVALMTSLKTLPLLLALLGAAALLWWQWPRAQRPSGVRIARASLAWLIGAAVPVLLVLWQAAARGAVTAMLDDAWWFNLDAGTQQNGQLARQLLLPLIALLTVLSLRGRVAQAAPEQRVAEARRVFVQSLAWFSTAIMLGAWPIVTRQDLLPLLPMLAPALVAWWRQRLHRSGSGRVATLAVPAGLALALTWTVATHLPWHSRTAEFSDWLGTVLAITRPGEPVLDAKGAAIYRPRPFHPVLETLTLARLRAGTLHDGEVDALRDSQTHVVSIERFSPAALAFVAANYVLLRRDLWVAGREGEAAPGSGDSRFALAIGGDYLVLDRDGHRVRGAMLDGLRVGAEGMHLYPGEHVLRLPDPGHTQQFYRVMWRPAAHWWQHSKGLGNA